MASNTDDDALERRLAAVERAVDGSMEQTAGDSPADEESREHRLAEIERRIDELDAALQAVRGFLGGVDAVNEAIESRADAAIAAVDRLERRLDESSKRGPEGVATPEPGDPVEGNDWVGIVERADEAAGGAARSQSADDDGDDERPLRDRLRDPW